MQILHTFIALAAIACSTTQYAKSGSESVQGFTASEFTLQREAESSLEALKERSVYAALDKQAVEDLARAAQAHWQKEFSGFAYQRVERFSAGEVSHWMSIWLHRKTDLEFVLLPGGKFRMGSPGSEPDRKDDELQHWVTLDPFLVARTECTWGAWTQGQVKLKRWVTRLPDQANSL